MNPFVADPDWGWWIIFYFYLGGIAAGAYFTATLVDLFAAPEDRELARMGYWIAFPLVSLCGLFLTVDLVQPERFWHMLLKSEVVHQALDEGWPLSGASWAIMLQAPLLKWWSPMSMGSWALLLFGVCSALTFLGSLWPAGLLASLLRRTILARIIQVVGCGVGFFVAAYTGALLTATSQPVWSDTTWVAPLFLASAASTGMAFLLLLGGARRVASPDSLHRLRRADVWVLVLEAVVFAIFLASLGSALPDVLRVWQGIILVAGTAVLGIMMPLALHLGIGRVGVRGALAAAVCALVGGFLLRYGILSTPGALLARGPVAFPGEVRAPTRGADWLPRISPEQNRRPGRRGADPLNRPVPAHPDEVTPRSKIFGKQ
jgi:formate-dependent nitrite reductase membrane component NrfD